MFTKEVYTAVRRYVHLEGNSHRDAARSLDRAGYDLEDVPVLDPAGVYADEAGGQAEARRAAAGNRHDPGGRSHGAGQTAPSGPRRASR